MKHWSRKTIAVTKRSEGVHMAGFCQVCFADMAVLFDGTVRHYSSHHEAKRLGLKWKRQQPKAKGER